MANGAFRIVVEPQAITLLHDPDSTELPFGTLDSRAEVDALIASLDAAADACFGPRPTDGTPR